jgi:hypothetical protein
VLAVTRELFLREEGARILQIALDDQQYPRLQSA